MFLAAIFSLLMSLPMLALAQQTTDQVPGAGEAGGPIAETDVAAPQVTEEVEEFPVDPSDEFPVDPSDDESESWVDAGHAAVDNRAQELAQWMDNFFGAEISDTERADTFIRAIFIDDWNQRDRHDFKVRLRGRVNLPKVSERVDLFFSGEDGNQVLSEEEREQDNDVGLRLNLRNKKSTRFDATLSIRSGPALLPGVRFRYQQPISENSWGRFTQRLQYHTEDGYRALSQFDLNRRMGKRSVLRWGGRVRYREDRGYWDWSSSVSYRKSFGSLRSFPSAFEYFASASGRDDPELFETNYRVGVLYRKQFLREFLYYEIEPNYNWRRDFYDEDREGVLGIVLRLEIMLGSAPDRMPDRN